MTKLTLTLALVAALINPATAKPHSTASYAHCLSRVIAAHGFTWAVNHAGATICDR